MSPDPVLWDIAAANLLCFGPWIALVAVLAVIFTWGDGPPK